MATNSPNSVFLTGKATREGGLDRSDPCLESQLGSGNPCNNMACVYEGRETLRNSKDVHY